MIYNDSLFVKNCFRNVARRSRMSTGASSLPFCLQTDRRQDSMA